MNAFATAFQVYVAALVFSRVGAMVMTMPGVGDQSVPPRIRLSFALLMASACVGAASACRGFASSFIGPSPSASGLADGARQVNSV